MSNAPKRRAAADVFMEQNLSKVVQQEPGVVLPEWLTANAPAAAGMPPPPAPQQSVSSTLVGGASYGYAEPAPQRQGRMPAPRPPQSNLKTSEELQLEKEPIRVRETGHWFWRRVIIPPNAYVVHTRMGQEKPKTIGLGLSFRYNPGTDAYLVVPAAMQTIGIVANGISKEKQGINILAYVQWQIADFSIAYRKLDFSDTRDPLGIVNAQLREQAEAAIKDKIATMTVEEVLTDKEPIIEELTTRLKTVAEGRQVGLEDSEGLGIKIVTVQIKEAYVSSQKLWENLQSPFRYEKEQAARISLLFMQDEIRKKELENRRFAETGEAETTVEIERTKQTKQTEAFEIRTREEQTRLAREQEVRRNKIQVEEQTTILQRESEQKLAVQKAEIEQTVNLAELQRKQQEALERARLAADEAAQRKQFEVAQALREIEEQERLAAAALIAVRQQIERDVEKQRLEAGLKQAAQEQAGALAQQVLEAQLTRRRLEQSSELELQEAANRVTMDLEERKARIERLHQDIRNLINEQDLFARFIRELPAIASNMPEVHELKMLQSGNDGFDMFTGFIARMMAVAETMGIKLPLNPTNDTPAESK